MRTAISWAPLAAALAQTPAREQDQMFTALVDWVEEGKKPATGTPVLLRPGNTVSGPALMGSKIPYDSPKDFATIGLATYVPYAIAVTGSLPVNNVKELIDLARAQPRKLNVASPGVGTVLFIGR